MIWETMERFGDIVYRCRIAKIKIPFIKVRRPIDRIIFIMVDLYTSKTDIYIETGLSMPVHRENNS